ncbi:MAG: hypothetical protein JJU13_11085 [Balneolaceae bacterium]|nr:hypothetical protein [Balneolaceae bacterium]
MQYSNNIAQWVEAVLLCILLFIHLPRDEKPDLRSHIEVKNYAVTSINTLPSFLSTILLVSRITKTEFHHKISDFNTFVILFWCSVKTEVLQETRKVFYLKYSNYEESDKYRKETLPKGMPLARVLSDVFTDNTTLFYIL